MYLHIAFTIIVLRVCVCVPMKSSCILTQQSYHYTQYIRITWHRLHFEYCTVFHRFILIYAESIKIATRLVHFAIFKHFQLELERVQSAKLKIIIIKLESNIFLPVHVHLLRVRFISSFLFILCSLLTHVIIYINISSGLSTNFIHLDCSRPIFSVFFQFVNHFAFERQIYMYLVVRIIYMVAGWLVGWLAAGMVRPRQLIRMSCIIYYSHLVQYV